MSIVHVIPEGTSEPQDFQLLNDGVPLVGTGLDVALEIESPRGQALSPQPCQVAWLSQANGTVRVTGIEELPIGRYRVRYILTNSASPPELGYVPNGQQPDIWHVVEV